MRFAIYLLINIVILAELSYIGYTNFMALLAHNPNMSHNELFYVLLATATLFTLFGMWLTKFVDLKQVKQLNEYKRELERRGIAKDESSSKVKVLESKIEVLEKALKEALRGK